MLDPGLVPEPECITVPVPLRRKVAVPVVPIPQHWVQKYLKQVNKLKIQVAFL